MAKEKGSRLIANNKKAYHDYFIEETYEAGIALHGTEVKSLRMGKCSIKESFVRIEIAIITGMKPAIFGQSFSSSFGILIIPYHHIRSLRPDFSYPIFIRIIYL